MSYPIKFLGLRAVFTILVPGLINYMFGHINVSLGFTRSQKGYKCFSPSLNRYFILQILPLLNLLFSLSLYILFLHLDLIKYIFQFS